VAHIVFEAKFALANLLFVRSQTLEKFDVDVFSIFKLNEDAVSMTFIPESWAHE
jgi:hypothetical protein